MFGPGCDGAFLSRDWNALSDAGDLRSLFTKTKPYPSVQTNFKPGQHNGATIGVGKNKLQQGSHKPSKIFFCYVIG
jgi:hypothetical protein